MIKMVSLMFHIFYLNKKHTLCSWGSERLHEEGCGFCFQKQPASPGNLPTAPPVAGVVAGTQALC